MSIKIAQASIDENGKVQGIKDGDQTGKELNIKEYKSGFDTIIRAKNKQVRANMSWIALTGACNKHIGYSQPKRNSLWKEARRTYSLANIVVDCACDCSSFASIVAELGYYSVNGEWLPNISIKDNLPCTANMVSKLVSTGQFDSIALKNNTSIELGDILLKKGHCAVVVEIL